MKNALPLLLILFLSNCKKQDVPQPEAARGGRDMLYLSEMFIDGKLYKKNVYGSGKLTKTQFFSRSGRLLSEHFYEYIPSNRLVRLTFMGYKKDVYFNSENQPIRIEDFGYNTSSPQSVYMYKYDKDKLIQSVQNYFTSTGGVDVATDDYFYQGAWLKRLEHQYVRAAAPNNVFRMVTNFNWEGPFKYGVATYGSQDWTYKYLSPTIKAPDYSMNLCPTGFAFEDGVKHRDLIKRNEYPSTIDPYTGMLLYKIVGSSNSRIYLTDIVTNKEGLPVSYQEVTENNYGGTVNTFKTKYNFTYVTIN